MTLLSVASQAQILGLSGQLNLRTDEKLAQCGSLELVFDSQIDRSLSTIETDHMRGRSTVPLPFNVLTPWTGSAVLAYTFTSEYVLPLFTCTTTTQPVNDTFRVVKLDVELNVVADDDPCQPQPRRRSVGGAATAAKDKPFQINSITIDVGAATESATYTCSSPPVSLTNQYLKGTSLFPHAWQGLHMAEYLSGNQYEIHDWSPGSGGSLLGRRTYVQTNSQFGPIWTETTTLDLFHRP